MDDDIKQILSQIRDNTHTLYYYDVGDHIRNIDETLTSINYALITLVVLVALKMFGPAIRARRARMDK